MTHFTVVQRSYNHLQFAQSVFECSYFQIEFIEMRRFKFVTV